MISRLEKFMESEGWTKGSEENCGVTYRFWRKNGFDIRDEDIVDVRE